MNPKPLISIVTVVYNGEKYLEQTIQSVKNQTYKNLEYIVIDGGSTDGTLKIIRNYENEIAYWISEPDKGLYDAMNKGIALAKGEIIGMINSDDWFEPDAVQLVVNAFREYPKKRIFHGDRFDILADGSKALRKFHPSRSKFLYYGMTYNHPSMFVHRDIYGKITYNIELQALSDYEFVLKNLLRFPEIFYYIPSAYVNYRLDGISGTMKFTKAIAEGFTARKNAGLYLAQNLVSVVLRSLRVFIGKIF